ncbi:MAG: hypothetical protein ACO1Q7_08625 [Gemmatimonas sp.]
MLLAAMLIQADSPSRNDAYWKAVPISGRKILWTKLLILAVLICPVMLTLQAPALIRHEVPLLDGMAYSVLPAMSVLPTILGPMVMAAVTPNIKAFATVAIAMSVFHAVINAITSAPHLPLPPAIEVVFQLIGYGGTAVSVWSLDRMYQRRWTVDQMRVVAVAVVLLLPNAALALRWGVSALNDQLQAEGFAKRMSLSIADGPSGTEVDVAAHIPSVPDYLALGTPRARVRLPDGRWYYPGLGGAPGSFDNRHYDVVIGGYSASGSSINQWSHPELYMKDDSLNFRLRFDIDGDVLRTIVRNNLPIEIDAALVGWKDIRHKVDLNSKPRAANARGVRASLNLQPDGSRTIELSERSLGSDSNVLRETFQNQPLGVSRILRAIRGAEYQGSFRRSELISKLTADTAFLLLREARSRAIQLVVPGTFVDDMTVILSQDSLPKNQPNASTMRDAVLDMIGARYSWHQIIHAKVRVPDSVGARHR